MSKSASILASISVVKGLSLWAVVRPFPLEEATLVEAVGNGGEKEDAGDSSDQPHPPGRAGLRLHRDHCG